MFAIQKIGQRERSQKLKKHHEKSDFRLWSRYLKKFWIKRLSLLLKKPQTVKFKVTGIEKMLQKKFDVTWHDGVE